MLNFVGRNQRASSPAKDEAHAAKVPESKPRERLRNAESMKMRLKPTTLSHGEAGDDDIRSLGEESSITVDTLKERQYHRHVEYDNFATDDEHADITTTGSLGLDDEYLTSGLPSQHGYPESKEHIPYGEDQPHVDFEKAESQFYPIPHELAAKMQNGLNAMKRWKDAGSFPPTTNGDLSEPEAADEGANVRGQHSEPHYQTSVQNKQHFTANIPERSAPSSDQLYQYGFQPTQDPFTSMRQQALSPRRNFRPSDIAQARATETGSPRPRSAKPKQQKTHPHNHINAPIDAQQLVPNGRPSTVSQPQGPPRSNSIVQGIQANSHKTLSTADEQSLDTSNESVLPLDYEEDKLHSMTYEELANESFDTNPRLDHSRLPSLDPTLPLSTRLSQLQHDHSISEQSAFFASLDIDEYDEAGAWMAQKLGTIISKVAQARREKRRVARAFEDEIRQRHDFVTRKKRRLDDEISQMRGKGQDLLPKTPGKSRAGSAMR